MNANVLKTAHVGITVYEPATGKTWFDYQGGHYFVPASNTKIPTCYAAMKYLGDSLVGLRYYNNGILFIYPSGDPTLLNSDFPNQPIFSFLKNTKADTIVFCNNPWVEEALGSGWSWNDYNEAYMAERSSLPVFGNLVLFSGSAFDGIRTMPNFKSSIAAVEGGSKISNVYRELGTNDFSVEMKGERERTIKVPFATQDGRSSIRILADTVHKEINRPSAEFNVLKTTDPRLRVIHSQPTDSLLRPMMHRSDNFFAEQALLMVSNEHLGFMNDAKIIDTLLKTDFKDLPQKPRWVDGSGLSRYNLFTPQDFVFILNKMKTEFGMTRLKNILATGGEGTLSNYYVAEKDFLYAKTGTLSGVVALSGFLTTKKGRELIFSVQVNNHNGSATEVRRAVEKFVEGLRERY